MDGGVARTAEPFDLESGSDESPSSGGRPTSLGQRRHLAHDGTSRRQLVRESTITQFVDPAKLDQARAELDDIDEAAMILPIVKDGRTKHVSSWAGGSSQRLLRVLEFYEGVDSKLKIAETELAQVEEKVTEMEGAEHAQQQRAEREATLARSSKPLNRRGGVIDHGGATTKLAAGGVLMDMRQAAVITSNPLSTS